MACIALATLPVTLAPTKLVNPAPLPVNLLAVITPVELILDIVKLLAETLPAKLPAYANMLLQRSVGAPRSTALSKYGSMTTSVNQPPAAFP